jgi:hypothetical protein
MISMIFKRCLTMRLLRNKTVFPERHLSFLGGTARRLNVASFCYKRGLFVVYHGNITHSLISRGIIDSSFHCQMGLLEGDSKYRTRYMLDGGALRSIRDKKSYLARDLKTHINRWCDPKRLNITNLFNIKAY